MGGPQGYHGYGSIMMDPATLAKVEEELAIEAELDAAIEANIDAQIKAQYESASLEEEAIIAEEEMRVEEEESQSQPPVDAGETVNTPPVETTQQPAAEKSG